MSQLLRYVAKGGIRHQQQCGESVPQTVKRDVSQTGFFDHFSVLAVLEIVRVSHVPLPVREGPLGNFVMAFRQP